MFKKIKQIFFYKSKWISKRWKDNFLSDASKEENRSSLTALRLVMSAGVAVIFPDLFAGDDGSILQAANTLHTTLFEQVVPAVQAVGGLTGLGYFIFSPSFKSAGVMVGAVAVPGLIGKMVKPAGAALLPF